MNSFEHSSSQLKRHCQSVVHQNAIVQHRHLRPQWIRIRSHQLESLFVSSLQTRLRRSIHVSSEVNYARRLLSNNLERLSSDSSVCCFCSFCSFCLLDLLGGSIAHTSWSLSMFSVVVRSTSITWTLLNFLSFGWAGVMLIGTWSVSSGTLSVSSDVATRSRLMFLVVFDSPPINCQNESKLLSTSFCWSGCNCHLTLDWVLVSLSELYFFVRCSVFVTSSSSENSFVFDRERFHFSSRMLSSLSPFLRFCGVSDHQSYERLKFSDISFFESVLFSEFCWLIVGLFLQFLDMAVCWVEMKQKWSVFFVSCCLAVWPVANVFFFVPVERCLFLTVLVAIATTKRWLFCKIPSRIF